MKNRFLCFFNKTTILFVLSAITFSSNAITDIFNDYDACEYYLRGGEPTSNAGLALKTGDASMLDEASQVIVAKITAGFGAKKAKKMEGNNEETIYFLTRGREGSNQGSANLDVMAGIDRNGICGGIGSPNSSFDVEVEETKTQENIASRDDVRAINSKFAARIAARMAKLTS